TRGIRRISRAAAHAAGWRADYFLWSDGRIGHRVSLVQRTPGGSVHGRRGLTRLGRRDWHGGRDDQAGVASAFHWRDLCDGGAVGYSAGGVVQAAQKAHL